MLSWLPCSAGYDAQHYVSGEQLPVNAALLLDTWQVGNAHVSCMVDDDVLDPVLIEALSKPCLSCSWMYGGGCWTHYIECIVYLGVFLRGLTTICCSWACASLTQTATLWQP